MAHMIPIDYEALQKTYAKSRGEQESQGLVGALYELWRQIPYGGGYNTPQAIKYRTELARLFHEGRGDIGLPTVRTIAPEYEQWQTNVSRNRWVRAVSGPNTMTQTTPVALANTNEQSQQPVIQSIRRSSTRRRRRHDHQAQSSLQSNVAGDGVTPGMIWSKLSEYLDSQHSDDRYNSVLNALLQLASSRNNVGGDSTLVGPGAVHQQTRATIDPNVAFKLREQWLRSGGGSAHERKLLLKRDEEEAQMRRELERAIRTERLQAQLADAERYKALADALARLVDSSERSRAGAIAALSNVFGSDVSARAQIESANAQADALSIQRMLMEEQQNRAAIADHIAKARAQSEQQRESARKKMRDVITDLFDNSDGNYNKQFFQRMKSLFDADPSSFIHVALERGYTRHSNEKIRQFVAALVRLYASTANGMGSL